MQKHDERNANNEHVSSQKEKNYVDTATFFYSSHNRLQRERKRKSKETARNHPHNSRVRVTKENSQVLIADLNEK